MDKVRIWARLALQFLLVGPKWAWIRSHQWAWFGSLVLGGFTVASMNEFWLAGVLFTLAGISALAQLWEWKEDGLTAGPTKFLKIVGTFFLFLAVLALWGIVNVYRDGKPWSQLPRAMQNARNWMKPPPPPLTTNPPQEMRPPIDLQPPTSVTIVTPGEMPFYPSRSSSLSLPMLFKENHIGNIRVANNTLYTFAGISGISVAALIDGYGVYSVLFYIPSGDGTYNACVRFAEQNGRAWWGIQDSLAWAERNGFAVDKAGMSRMRVGKPVFSKHVILYTEDEMDFSQKGLIQEKYRQNGLTIDFRDGSFLQQELIDRGLNNQK